MQRNISEGKLTIESASPRLIFENVVITFDGGYLNNDIKIKLNIGGNASTTNYGNVIGISGKVNIK